MHDQMVINLLKGLVIDGVHTAQSGHPGGAMSSMDFAYILYSEFLSFDPRDPLWLGRDRFILSAGHESMLLYSLLMASGMLPLAELKKFRQLHSKTPGHPEYGVTPGVECTTGPLGQGCAMSVGFAIAAKNLAARLDEQLFANRTWVLLGDGCMQECVTLGAASLAGHLKLKDLIWYYDKNCQQISGDISRATSDREDLIFQGFGWNVEYAQAHDHASLRRAIHNALKEQNRPTLIIGESTMAKGAFSMEGQHNTHGAPLPHEEREQTKSLLGIPEGEDFYWPPEAQQHFQRKFGEKSEQAQNWRTHLQSKQQNPDFAQSFAQHFQPSASTKLPALSWDKAEATRSCFGRIIEQWCDTKPQLIGGSADLEPSNMTGGFAQKVGDFRHHFPQGRNLAFGVREFPMSAISNGIALYGGHIPFDATFLVFADYSRAAIRLGALQQAQVIHEFTHDSFYVGEDGPTHQPVEHLLSLRAIPNLFVMRPADGQETEAMMRVAMAKTQSPSCLCLSRQKLPLLTLTPEQKDNMQKGAWIVKECANPKISLYATGAEVHLALEVAHHWEKQGLGQNIRVISVPCWELFFQQDLTYQQHILSPQVQLRVSIEAGCTLGWEKFVGDNGLKIGLDHFGESGKASDLAKEFGFTVESICQRMLEQVGTR